MRDLTDSERKALKALLLLSVIVSLIFGLKGVFIDLYDPGSPVARQYSDLVNVIFVLTLLTSLPLFFEKYKKLTKWHDRFSSSGAKEQRAMLWNAARPYIIQMVIIAVITIVASVVIAYVWQIPPDVMTAYKDYYSSNASPIVFGKDINISAVNNITVNSTNP